MRGQFRGNWVVGALALLAVGSPAAAQDSNSPVTGYGACRVSIKVTRPFPIANGVVQKDLERLVHDWNMNSKVPSMDGRCAVGTLAEIQEYVGKWSNENGLELVDYEPDWQVITFNRLGGGAKAEASTRPGKAKADAPAASTQHGKPAQGMADDRREKATEAHAAVEARNRAAQAKYEAELADQKRQVEEFERAKQERARKQAEQKAAAQAALAEHDAQLAAAAEAQRKHEAELAVYNAEVEAAAGKVRSDFDKRNGLGQASTDTDANQCVTTPETQLNAAFQGNTAASVMNGCGQAVDVMICLMTDTGWKCGATYGLASQQRWSFSAFKATGQVFADSRTSGSNRPLAKPN